ncbi:hypothetical protein [Methanolobus profundi]|uniref:Uncharacterized protein n=1 Tax=Methanolobus profundi TaxID=487685 RepID=A0A1I4S9K9_9EURY|nr:hypothetical protein [Methanolobus profundi]SFM60980.1 hypothetical protein SAMN04488696_1844 [Methanolobus profundi]
MNSLNLSDESKKAEKTAKVFTPNIYRKPIVKEEMEKEAGNDTTPVAPVNYVPGAVPVQVDQRSSGNHANVVTGFDFDGFIQKEAQLVEIRKRYELEISEYEAKQKELDDLRSKFSDQEKALNKKCSILKSAMEKADRAIPKEKKEGLENEIAEFEKRRSEFESKVKEFESSRRDHEKEFSEYSSKMEELTSLRSTYDAELEEYSKKKAELDEQCRSLEEKLASGEEISLELAEATCPAAVEVLKESFYAELKELNRKKADIETLRTQLEDDESLLTEKRSSIEKMKGHIQTELSEISNKATELERSVATYEERLKSHEDKELSFQDKVKAFEDMKIEFKAEREKLKLDHEEKIKAYEKTFEDMKANFKTEREQLKLKHEENIKAHEEKEHAFHEDMKALEARKAEIRAETEKLGQKREENSKFEAEMENALAEMEAKRKELDEMVEKTNKEIGNHVTIHRQDLDIKKLNNKLEQQTIYIQSLESNVADLKRSLEEARSDFKKNEVFSQILKTNIELMR